MGLLSAVLSLFVYNSKKHNSNGSENIVIERARQIKIDQLENQLELLQKGKTEFDFIGITSNGVDCIYFTYKDSLFNIEYEAMTQEQLKYIERLKVYASDNEYAYIETTYGNKPEYNINVAPVLIIKTNTSLQKTAMVGADIQKTVFKNNKSTDYNIVP